MIALLAHGNHLASCVATAKCKIVNDCECHIDDAGALNVSSEADFRITALDIEASQKITMLIVNVSSLRLKIFPTSIFTVFPSLEHIVLASVGITSIGGVHFVNASNLTNLNLQNNSIQTLPARLFVNTSKLEVINLSANRIEMIDAATFDLPALQELYLQKNRIKHLPKSVFARLPHLKELDLECNQLTQIGSALADVSHTLHTLGLGNNRLADVALRDFSTYPALTYLSLENTGINLAPTTSTTAQHSNSSLVYLNLSSNNLSSPDILEELKIFGNLVELQLVNNNFSYFNNLTEWKSWFPALNYLPVIDNNALLCEWIATHIDQFRNMEIQPIVNYDETNEHCMS